MYFDVGTRSRATVVLPWLVLALRLVLGGVWIVAGALKVTDPDASVRAVRAYRLLPETAAQLVGAGLPPVEIVLGALLVIGLGVRVAGVASALLMARSWSASRRRGRAGCRSTAAASAPAARSRPASRRRTGRNSHATSH